MQKKLIRNLAIPVILALYVLIAMAVVFFVSRSGNFLDGADTMFYTYRADFLYKSITQEGNWFPLLDMSWYNGVQTWRYWSPLSAFVLAACQALRGGSINDGFLLFGGILYFLDAAVWLYIGYRHDRPWLGAIIGALWFFIPNTSAQMLYSEGVLDRAMSMPALPLLFSCVADYLDGAHRRTPILLKLIFLFIFIILCNFSWAVMIAIALVIFCIYYKLVNHAVKRVAVLPVFGAFVLAVLLAGLWTVPSFFGQIAGKGSSSAMATCFQSLRLSIDPFYFLSEGYVNRWVYTETCYYGFSTLLLSILAVLCCQKKSFPAFAASLTILFLSTPTAYKLLVLFPGSQYLWMTRFMSIALCLVLIGFFFWISLRKWIVWAFLFAFSVEMLSSAVLVTTSSLPIAPDSYYEYLSENMLIDDAKEITSQRMSIADPYDVDIAGIDVICGFGDKRFPTSFGRGVQAAANYYNIVQVNEAADGEAYLYMFDRYLELGNDTVIVPIKMPSGQTRELSKLNRSAQAVGYRRVAENDNYQVFHIETPDTFGVISKYRAIAIGSSSGMIALDYPVVEEADSPNLDDYSYEQLSEYDVIYLAGFNYDDREHAEDMILHLTEDGKRVVILADGIPLEKRSGTRSFLGVTAYNISFHNGYPELNTTDGYLHCSLFPETHTNWQTVYVNGLDDVWGTIEEEGQRLDFYGTVHNENLIFIGLNLTYHYALTRDEAVGHLLSHALNLSQLELPDRMIVPLSIDYRDNTITIHSELDNVNTTLAWQDIFTSEQPIQSLHNQLHIQKGDTIIRLHYPWLITGLIATVLGLLFTVQFLRDMRTRERMERAVANAAETFRFNSSSA